MKKLLYKINLIVFASLSGFAIFAADPELRVSPDPLVKGGNGEINISSSQGLPELLEMPDVDGIRWLGRRGQSSKTEIINFKTSTQHTVSYGFSVEKEGDIKFPALKLKLGNKKVACDPFTVKSITPSVGTLSSSDSEEGLEKYIFAKVFPLTDKNEFYLGEEIPFEIAVFCGNGIRTEYSWPEINVPNIVFKDFGQVNKDNPKFAGFSTTTENLSGKSFNTYRFRTTFKAITPGTLSGTVTVPCRIFLPRSREQRRRPSGFGDSFFDSFFDDAFSSYERVDHTISCDMPNLRIVPLPEKPANSIFTGLVGDWKFSFRLSSSKFNLGESFILKIELEGKGGMDNLRAPELSIEGFRIYPPEIRRFSSPSEIVEKASVEYVIVPLEEGEASLDVSLLSFSSSKKEYEKWTFARKITVGKAENISKPSVMLGTETIRRSEEPDKKTPDTMSDILYLKRNSYGSVSTPVWTNNLYFAIIVFFVGPFFLLISKIVFIFFRGSDSVGNRKSKAIKRKKYIMGKIRKLNGETSNVFIRDELCPWLNDVKGYPPGTSAEEIAEKIDDKELAELISNSAKGAYMPEPHNKDDENVRKILSNGVKRIVGAIVIALVMFSNLLSAQDVSTTALNKDPFQLYDAGMFQEAGAAFAEQLSKSPNDPYLLYNIGCCSYRYGRLSEALYFFEKANMLAPRDSDIRENMNHTRRKLNIPEKGLTDNPKELLLRLRDTFRPDEWILIFSIFSSSALVVLAIRKRISYDKLCVILLFCSTCVAIAVLAIFSQLTGDYNSDAGIVVRRGSALFILPSENSEKTEIRPFEGQRVKVVEERSDWSIIRLES
ncbi:MAG TPA: hypothetical protein PK821_04190, partial [Victivallales bacterium]|nr:hypothetical protein [Victivallales bacterium]